jgi:hypothetical protein
MFFSLQDPAEGILHTLPPTIHTLQSKPISSSPENSKNIICSKVRKLKTSNWRNKVDSFFHGNYIIFYIFKFYAILGFYLKNTKKPFSIYIILQYAK